MGLLLRRRALLAASQTGGGNGLEFPLYLNFDYCEDSWGYKYCYINDNEVVETYYNYLKSECLKYDDGSINYQLPEESRIALGIEIYFDGNLATGFSFDSSTGNIFFYANTGHGRWSGRNITVEYSIW